MDLSLRTETFGAGDQSWLGSAHGTGAARSITIDRSSLVKATHFPDNRLKSGFALAKVGDLYVPYNAAGTGGTDVLAVFLLTDQSVKDTGGNIIASGLDHGRVKLARLPFPVLATAKTTGQFVFV